MLCALSLLLSLVGEEGEVEESHLQQERTSQDAPPHPIENLVVGDEWCKSGAFEI